ncbi:hypothetical protein K503DRAFT_775402 [Rhizopogon vinicolor AM-OR11-026]|uniref:Uncharacterized protein n=1 Tax=Rhizopogon vinicolor AM-OR11-026 TaxID=1314800 RepID=A0A1B7MM12_9AGAM|nr:hypothetical protein K503DRAFT_775402 [Rhizopogon vinicolor AM-OR11-026]
MSNPICVFLESREQRLPTYHPFYLLVQETLQNVIHCPIVSIYMANSILQNEQYPDEVAEKQRVEQIIHYLHNNCPTISGSDSPAMDSTFIDVRAYSGCSKGPKSIKFARKHVYIQKRLVDAWMRTLSAIQNPYPSSCLGSFYLLTFFIKLCLVRGLITVVKLAFISEDIDARDQTCDYPGSPHGSPCTFERFLWEWNGWLVKFRDFHLETRYEYIIYAIVFADSSCQVEITGNLKPRIENEHTVLHLAAGDWTFPPAIDAPYELPKERIWDSPPTDNPKPRLIETTPWKSQEKAKPKGLFSFAAWFNRAEDSVEEE